MTTHQNETAKNKKDKQKDYIRNREIDADTDKYTTGHGHWTSKWREIHNQMSVFFRIFVRFQYSEF